MGLRISQRRGRTAVALATWPSPICTLSPGMSPVGIASRSSIARAVTTSGSERFTSASLTFWTEEHYRTWKVQIVRIDANHGRLARQEPLGNAPTPCQANLALPSGAGRAPQERRGRIGRYGGTRSGPADRRRALFGEESVDPRVRTGAEESGAGRE